jgi:lipopolysaccharide export system protein LptC
LSVFADTGSDSGRMARSRDAFVAAHRHSRTVRRLRWMLPASALIIALLFAVTSLVMSLVGRFSIGSISMQGNQIVMERPRLTGFDGQRRPYEVAAEVARQDISSPKKFDMQRVDASMSFGSSGRARVTADTGHFDGDREVFVARGNIEVTTNVGYVARLEEAEVDLKRATMRSDRPVEARSGQDSIRADRLDVQESGAVVVFEGNVRMIIHSAGIDP